MRKYITLLSIILIITSCDVEEGPYNIKEDCAGIIGGGNICGCTDINAYNYDNTTTFDDGSCCDISGCTNPLALNYDSLACFDNDSCLFDGGNIYGCMDSTASNYDPSATIDDGGCIPFVKNVLIEDFTGHLCPNCPDAARELSAIHNVYGGQIIGMALHVTKSFARPYSASQAPAFQYDFRTNWGDDWDAFYEISDSGLPRGMINRIGYSNEHGLGMSEWADAVSLELEKEIDFGIIINPSSNSIAITSVPLNDINGNYNLVICLTESNIINWQKDGQDNVENYEHNHVLRTVLIDQELSNSTNYVAGQQIETTINYDLATLEQFNIDYSLNNISELGNGNAGGWEPSNMSVVAYIYNTNTKEIAQVEETHLNN